MSHYLVGGRTSVTGHIIDRPGEAKRNPDLAEKDATYKIFRL
jgi:hypothetical protein